MNEDRDRQMYDPPSSLAALERFVAGVAGGLLLLGVVVYLATNWKAVVAYAWVALLVLGILVALVLTVVGMYVREDLEHRREIRAHAHKRREQELKLQVTRLYADERGNRPFIYDEQTGQLIEVSSGNYVQPVPQHFAPHYTYEYQDKSTRSLADPLQAELPAPHIVAPSMDSILSLLEENRLQVCLGVSATTGAPFVLNLLDGVHYKFIGSSGMGKSCLAGALLDMTTRTNDPDHLMIALLDLEHKTSLLFENLPHVAELLVGRRRVPCVATDADEVAIQLGYLRKELDRRKALSEDDLQRERFLLIYVEEFLSLKLEVDEALKAQMLADFTILAVRGRKYGMYLLACAQDDYADDELKSAKNQFRVKGAFGVPPSAARSAGFMSTDLIKQNYQAQVPGQFVLETRGCNDLMLAPQYDLKKLLQRFLRPVQPPFSARSVPQSGPDLRLLNGGRTTGERLVNADENSHERASQGRAAEVLRLREMGWGKQAIIEKVWNVKKGGSPRYKVAEGEYEAIIRQVE